MRLCCSCKCPYSAWCTCNERSKWTMMAFISLLFCNRFSLMKHLSWEREELSPWHDNIHFPRVTWCVPERSNHPEGTWVHRKWKFQSVARKWKSQQAVLELVILHFLFYFVLSKKLFIVYFVYSKIPQSKRKFTIAKKKKNKMWARCMPKCAPRKYLLYSKQGCILQWKITVQKGKQRRQVVQEGVWVVWIISPAFSLCCSRVSPKAAP